jgi:hypothetical protein
MKCATKAEAKKAATVKVKEHERKMHSKDKYAAGGMVARGCGAATKGKKFTRAG